MQQHLVRILLALCVGASLLFAVPALAHPEACEQKSEEYEEGECFTDEQIAEMDDSGATLGENQIGRSKNLKQLANLPKSGPFEGTSAFNSDLAFWGKYAIQGNYNGFQITDISAPSNPKVVAQMNCPGSQNDVSVYKNLIITSTDSRRTNDTCASEALSPTTTPRSNDPNAEYWEGLKIFDWSNPAAPRLVKTVETDCGSHTNTLLPEAGRLLIYVSSYDVNTNAKDCRSTSSHFDHDKISIVEVPLGNPGAARVIAEPVLFPDGGNVGDADTRTTRGCHDITVYQAIGLAAGACMGEGVIMDIRNPEAPVVLANIYDNENFAFWHSATFSNNGKKVIFTDELGGGGSPTCNPTVGDKKGADAIYDISNPAAPKLLSYFKIPRPQQNTENCVAHNGIVLPTPDRDLFVQAWYQGGTSVIDFTNAKAPREIAYFERGPVDDEQLVLGGAWSSYWYRGHIIVNDIQKGLDVLKFSDKRAAKAQGVKEAYLNAQTQRPLSAVRKGK